jgi:tRNA(adenine34) deaminase
MENNQDIFFMKEALKEAKKAYLKEEVPVGCVIVYNNEIIARAHNTRHKNKSALDHAEILAIKKANKKLNAWMLDGATLYVTLEPCLMCAGAIFQSRIKRVVYAASEPKFGSFGSVINVSNPEYKFNHKIELTKGVLEEESALLLKTFFKEIRTKKQSFI